MSLDYRPHYCENCGREQGGKLQVFNILFLYCY